MKKTIIKRMYVFIIRLFWKLLEWLLVLERSIRSFFDSVILFFNACFQRRVCMGFLKLLRVGIGLRGFFSILFLVSLRWQFEISYRGRIYVMEIDKRYLGFCFLKRRCCIFFSILLIRSQEQSVYYRVVGNSFDWMLFRRLLIGEG